jgi:hypothetical protein
MKDNKHIQKFNEHGENLNISDVSDSYDNDWNDAFNKVGEGLRNQPIHYKDNHNMRGEVYLKELYDKCGIDFEDGLDTLVDLVAYLISEGGYKIIKK